MNDTELDELLDTWTAPTPGASMRESLRVELTSKGMRPPRKLFTRWRVATIVASVVVVVLVVNPDAFSSKTSTYIVESEINHYDGAPRWTEWPRHTKMTSYNEAGSEVLVSWSFPGHPLDTGFLKLLALTDTTAERVKQRINRLKESYYIWKHDLKTSGDDRDKWAVTYPFELDDRPFLIGPRAELLSSGCRANWGGWKVIGEDIILNHRSAAVQGILTKEQSRVVTLWMAPELSCFVLRATLEIKQADGTWKLVSERKAVKVTVNDLDQTSLHPQRR
jgi:hypothetical protein